MTIFLTTHRLEEAERLCDRVAILNTTLRRTGRPAELRDQLFTKELTVKFSMAYNPMEFASTLQSIAEGQVDVGPMITGTVGIEGVPQAFTDLANPDAHAKIVVEP